MIIKMIATQKRSGSEPPASGYILYHVFGKFHALSEHIFNSFKHTGVEKAFAVVYHDTKRRDVDERGEQRIVSVDAFGKKSAFQQAKPFIQQQVFSVPVHAYVNLSDARYADAHE